MTRIKRRWLPSLAAASCVAALSAAVLADDAAREGIQVHGQWRIEVFDPDGTRVSVTEFENALLNPDAIAQLMAGQTSYGGWYVTLEGAAPPCLDSQQNAVNCNIGMEGVNYFAIQMHSTNLTVQSAPGGHILLQGSVTAAATGSVGAVSSRFGYCSGSDVSPALCVTQGRTMSNALTGTMVDPAPSVVPGQLIQVTVDISFGSVGG